MTKKPTRRELAYIAKALLFSSGGFTLDEDGQPAGGDLWAVSVAGQEQQISGKPSIDELEHYLWQYPLVRTQPAYWGGWYDRRENITYLDHTELWAHKHVAIQQAQLYEQKAIYNLATQETIELEEKP